MKAALGSLFRTSLIYGGGQALSRLLSMLLLPVFTTFLTPADYGVNSILTAITLVATPVFSLGLGTAMAPSYFDGDLLARKQATIWTAAAMLAASVALMVVAGVLGASWISRVAFGRPDYARLVVLSSLTVGFNILSIPFAQFLQFERKAVVFVIWTITTTALTLGASVVMVARWRWGLTGYLEAGLLGQIFGCVFLIALSLPRLRPRVRRAEARELLRLGLPLIPAFACLYVLQQGNKAVLQWFRGLEDVGTYTVGLSLGSALSLAVTSMTTAWTPFFMSYLDRRDEAPAVFGRVVTYYVYGMGGFSLLFFFAARPAVMILTKPAFHAAYLVVGLSATAQMLSGLFSLLLPGIYFAKHIRYLSLIEGVAAVVAVVAAVVLIPPFGVFGAALALVVGTLALVATQAAWNHLRRESYISIAYESARLWRFAGGYIVLAAVALAPREWPLTVEIGASGVLTVALVAFTVWLLSPAERTTLVRLLKKPTV